MKGCFWSHVVHFRYDSSNFGLKHTLIPTHNYILIPSKHCYTLLLNMHHHLHTLTLSHTHTPRVLTTQKIHQMWGTMLRGCGHQILNKHFKKHLPFTLPVVAEKSSSQMKGRCMVSWLELIITL